MVSRKNESILPQQSASQLAKGRLGFEVFRYFGRLVLFRLPQASGRHSGEVYPIAVQKRVV